MIVDRIENAHLYTAIGKRIAKALDVLKDTDFTKKDNGQYDIDADNLYYLVQRYTTEPAEKRRPEAHEKYIDIQYLAEGKETMGYSLLEELEVDTPYNEQKDIIFYKQPKDIGRIHLLPGVFAILYPQDAHCPKCQLDGPAEVLKVVVKVKIND